MKKLFLILALFVLADYGLAQQTYFKHLEYNSDTSAVFNLYKKYKFMNVTVENTGSVTCTLYVKGGTIKKNSVSGLWDVHNYQYQDTTWYDVPMRTEAWDIANTIILTAGQSKSYLVIREALDLIRVYTSNTSGMSVDVFIEVFELSGWR